MIFMSFSCSVMANNITESVAVVSFQPSTQVMFKSSFESYDATEELVGTNVFTMCFRYMTRFLSGFECIFETNQMKFCVFQKYAFFLLRQWNVSSPNEEYRRVVTFCKPVEPGHWVSVCLRVKLQGNIQEVTFSQDGEICFHNHFLDGTFDVIYFKDKPSLNDTLRYSVLAIDSRH